jgi:hypothetical protein
VEVEYSQRGFHPQYIADKEDRVFNKLRAFTILAVIGIVGCSASNSWLVQVWTDPSITDRPAGKTLIIGMAREDVNRRLFESEMSALFEFKGVDADASYTLLPELPEANESGKEAVRAAIAGKRFKTVLVTRLIRIETEVEYVPGTAHSVETLDPDHLGFFSHYGQSYTVVHEPGYLVQNQVVRLETRMFDVASEVLIWAAVSETFNPETVSDVVRTFGAEMLEDLEKNKLLK